MREYATLKSHYTGTERSGEIVAVREDVVFIYLFPYFCWLAQTVPFPVICATLCTIGLLFYPADRGGTLLRNVGKYVRLHGVPPQKTVVFVSIQNLISLGCFRLFPFLELFVQ